MRAQIQTQILREQWEVEPRLLELGVTRAGLMKVAALARAEAANATPFHPVNSSGTFAYHEGTYALRAEFVGPEWKSDRTNGIEAIWNESKKVRVAFANVDVCCNDFVGPKPRSRKGSGAERACTGNMLFADLPQYAPELVGDQATFFLMLDEKGLVEFTRPTIENATFKQYIERLYLGGIDDDLDEIVLKSDDGGVAGGFDPEVTRKSG